MYKGGLTDSLGLKHYIFVAACCRKAPKIWDINLSQRSFCHSKDEHRVATDCAFLRLHLQKIPLESLRAATSLPAVDILISHITQCQACI